MVGVGTEGKRVDSLWPQEPTSRVDKGVPASRCDGGTRAHQVDTSYVALPGSIMEEIEIKMSNKDKQR